MQKVDVAIVLVGAAALVATLLGVLTYDDGEHDYVFTQMTSDLETLAPMALSVNGEAATFTWEDLAQNATSTNVTVEVTVTGTALTGGSFSVTAVLTDPTGATVTSEPVTLTVAPGPATGTATVSFASSWAMTPEPFRGAHEDLAQFALNHSRVLSIDVSLEGSGSPLTGQLAFEASVMGDVTAFEARPELPDAQAAQ